MKFLLLREFRACITGGQGLQILGNVVGLGLAHGGLMQEDVMNRGGICSGVSISGATGAAAPGPRHCQGPMKEEKKNQLSRIATGPCFCE